MDAYGAIGLARNPFVADPTPGVSPDLWVNRGHPEAPAPAASRLVQVLGPKGAGKTSLLLSWRRQVAGPYRHVPPGWRRLRPLPLGPIVYWDEADRIPSPLLRVALRRCAGRGATVAVGTHVDLTEPASRAGLTVTTIEPARLVASEVATFARRRIAAVARPGESTPTLTEGEAATVAARAGRSWRRVGDLLHVWAAELAGR